MRRTLRRKLCNNIRKKKMPTSSATIQTQVAAMVLWCSRSRLSRQLLRALAPIRWPRGPQASRSLAWAILDNWLPLRTRKSALQGAKVQGQGLTRRMSTKGSHIPWQSVSFRSWAALSLPWASLNGSIIVAPDRSVKRSTSFGRATTYQLRNYSLTQTICKV